MRNRLKCKSLFTDNLLLQPVASDTIIFLMNTRKCKGAFFFVLERKLQYMGLKCQKSEWLLQNISFWMIYSFKSLKISCLTSSLNPEAFISKQLKSSQAFICPDIIRKRIRMLKYLIEYHFCTLFESPSSQKKSLLKKIKVCTCILINNNYKSEANSTLNP